FAKKILRGQDEGLRASCIMAGRSSQISRFSDMNALRGMGGGSPSRGLLARLSHVPASGDRGHIFVSACV
ncbi:MAG: hypothetical protein ACRCVA_23060, partial [Phreatobacter sp.]